MNRWRTPLLPALLVLACAGPQTTTQSLEQVLAHAKPDDWRAPDPQQTLYVDVNGGRVVIELAPAFAPQHVAAIRALAQRQFYDGQHVVRVQENYVVQWGGGELQVPALPDEYTRTADDLAFAPLPDGDVYAPEVGFVDGLPAARDPAVHAAWLAHCWSMVGVGRDMPPDNGNGSELYVVSGHAPRHLDRNLAVVGRVLSGMPLLTALPRGTEAMGFYASDVAKPPIRVRLASDVPLAARVKLEVLRTDTATWQAYIAARRTRREPFFVAPTGRIELCNALPPVRTR